MRAILAYAAGSVIDAAIAKALGVSELARLASLEVRLRRMHAKAWNGLSSDFAGRASKALLAGKGADDVVSIADRVFGSYPGEVTKAQIDGTDEAYRLGRELGWKKATKAERAPLLYSTQQVTKLTKQAVDIKYDLVDAAALSALNRGQTWWIGDLYDKGVKRNIALAAEKIVREGTGGRSFGAAELKRLLAEASTTVTTPTGFSSNTNAYFEGTVANAVNTARNQGTLRSFLDLGITRYEIMNPEDERTCPVCSHMNGKVFRVSHGTQVMEKEIKARSPNGVKSAHPWLNEKQLKEVSPQPGRAPMKDSDKLANAGFSMPPYHFKCRCGIDATEEAASWLPDPDAPEPKLTAKAPRAAKPKTVKPATEKPGVQKPAVYDKSDPVAPHDFDVKTLYRALSNLNKRKDSLEAQRAVRQELNSLLAKYSFADNDLLLKKVDRARIEVRKSLNEGRALGLHYVGKYGTGRIAVTDSVCYDASILVIGRTKSARRALHTYVHEAVHSGAPTFLTAGTTKADTVVYHLLEELSTELSTRHLLLQEFGLTLDQVREAGAYKDLVGKMSYLLRDAFDKSHRKPVSTKTCEEVLGKMSVAFRTTETSKLKGVSDMLDSFASGLVIPDELAVKLTPAERVEVREKVIAEFKAAFMGSQTQADLKRTILIKTANDLIVDVKRAADAMLDGKMTFEEWEWLMLKHRDVDFWGLVEKEMETRNGN